MRKNKWTSASAPSEQCGQTTEHGNADASSSTQNSTQPNASRSQVATFSQFYTSRDRRFIVFEDEDGHLTSVNAARLAE